MGYIQDLSAHPFGVHGVLQRQEWPHSRNVHAELGIAAKPLILQAFGAVWEGTASPAWKQQHNMNQRTPQCDTSHRKLSPVRIILETKIHLTGWCN